MNRSGLTLLALPLLLASALLRADEGRGTISEALSARLAGLTDSQTVPVILTLAQREDPSSVRLKSTTVGGMIRSLRDSVGARFGGILLRNGATGPAKLFWINQTVGVDATRDFIERLSRDPDVALIDADDPLFSSEPVGGTQREFAPSAIPPWNLTLTGVDSVWDAYGLDGTGVLIGSLDTGIDPGHPALIGKLRPVDAWKDFIFGQPSPYDNLGHGTFGSGILAGAGGPNGAMPAIGIAYRSRLVVGKILDAGASTISQVTTGMQWILDPDGDPGTDDFPRVVNNSWFSGTRGSTYAYAAADAWRAAGIIPVFCAGNAGPSAGTTRSPGDYKICISVGGTNAADSRYANTSVGPSPADTNFFPADGRKPDLSAPGEGVLSSQIGGGFGTSSGTSWSSAHVAGIIALMLQANPALDYSAVMSILRRTAVDLGDPGYDYVFGYGRISAMGAVTEALRIRVSIQAETLLRTTESGGSASFDVALAVVPMDTVWVSIGSTDSSEGTTDPGLLFFTTFNWMLPQRVSVTGIDDDTQDGDVGYAIVMRTRSADTLYDGLEPAAREALNEDDEDAVRVEVGSGWNLVSLPTIQGVPLRSEVFPTSISQAFAYDSGYSAHDTLRKGAGYWLKFDEPQTISIPGDTTAAETVAVRTGWNLIGSITRPIATSGIVSEPPGMITSHFFEYQSGYQRADTIRPGLGYWVKLANAGSLILRSDATDSNKFSVSSIKRHRTILRRTHTTQ